MPIRGRGPWSAPSSSSRHVASPSHPGTTDRIKEYRTLSRFSNSSAALSLLVSIGRTVAPLMAKYSWRLPLLSEFLPSNPNLLGINVNRGQRISLRLRWDISREELIDEEQVTLVMLHELCHNVHGPHDERFYALLDNITEEYYEAKRKGRWEGEGFLSAGRRLGGRPGRGIAGIGVGVRRGGAGSKTAEPPRRLGGSTSTTTAATPADSLAAQRQRAAEAAERRRRDARACPDSAEEIEMVASQTERDERGQKQDVIIIDSDDDNDNEDDDRNEATRGEPRFRDHTVEDAQRKGDDGVEGEVVFAGVRRSSDARRKAAGASVKIELNDVLATAPRGTASATSPQPSNHTHGSKRQPSDSIIVLSSDTEDEARPAPRPTQATKRARPAASASTLQSRSADALRLHNSSGATSRRWTCQVCTLLNPLSALACEACQSRRPSSSTTATGTPREQQRGEEDTGGPGWTCGACGFRMKDGAAAFWSCSVCGQVKKSSEANQAGWGAVLGGGGY
ncbi:hypothetical protein ACQY0O_000117 [Thecaphora frezii]